MGLTLLGAVFSLVRMIPAYSLRGAYSHKSKSFVANDDAPGKKEEGGREEKEGRRERNCSLGSNNQWSPAVEKKPSNRNYFFPGIVMVSIINKFLNSPEVPLSPCL